MRAKFLVVLSLLGIFVSGGLAGFFFHKLAVRPDAPQETPLSENLQEITDRQLFRLVQQLDLDTEQRQQLRPVIASHLQQIRELRQESMREVSAVYASMNAAIHSFLNEDQAQLFEELQEQQRERMRRALQERRNGPRPMRPSPAVPEEPTAPGS